MTVRVEANCLKCHTRLNITFPTEVRRGLAGELATFDVSLPSCQNCGSGATATTVLESWRNLLSLVRNREEAERLRRLVVTMREDPEILLIRLEMEEPALRVSIKLARQRAGSDHVMVAVGVTALVIATLTLMAQVIGDWEAIADFLDGLDRPPDILPSDGPSSPCTPKAPHPPPSPLSDLGF
ncbi:hypothetical protein [Nonomuraea sp. NPDC050643]|uniref:hypothetical protein n=1 Tax=Nonomuraea sp. NPDC050643 TaxID=3155660 RepID=UPI0033E792D1